MKRIKIDFVDFHGRFNKENNDFTNILRERYEVEISEKPDYVFCSSFGRHYLNYDCIRIFFTGECITPDFNHFDYAMAFDRMEYDDRYLRLPLYRVFQYRKFYDSIFQPLGNLVGNEKRTEFCSFVYSNCFADDIRTKFYHLLSSYKHVNSGGRYLNNVGGPVVDKFEFQKRHKFSVAIENGSYPGYSTEKIVEAFAAGTIPIYIGDCNISDDFNEKCFINGHNYATLEEIVERVKEIDSNDELYQQMLAEIPAKVDNRDNEDMRQFLFSIFDQELGNARRRPDTHFSREEENHYRRYALIDNLVFEKIARFKRMVHKIQKGVKL